MKDKDESLSDAGQEPATDIEPSEDDLWNELVNENSDAADEAADDDDQEEDPSDDSDAEDDPSAPDTDGDAEPLSLEDLKKQNERLEQKFRSERARSIGQQRRAERLKQELDDLRGRSKAEDKDDDNEERTARKEKIKAAAEEYGDVVGPLIEEIQDLNSRLDGLSNSEQQRLSSLEGEIEAIEQEELAKLHEEHPDGLKVVGDHREVFQQWIEDQPKRYRDIYAANQNALVDGTGAALIVSRFKSALREAEQTDTQDESQAEKSETGLDSRRKRQLEGARSTRTGRRQSAVTDTPSPDSDDEEALWKYWQKQDAKKERQGF